MVFSITEGIVASFFDLVLALDYLFLGSLSFKVFSVFGFNVDELLKGFS